MDLQKIFTIIQVVVGIIMAITILMQSSSSSLGSAFGGGDTFHSVRRGPEKTLHYITIGLAITFVGLSFVIIFL